MWPNASAGCVERLATRSGEGGFAVRKPLALYAATSRSSRLQLTATARGVVILNVRTRRTVGRPGGTTFVTDVGVLRPPPLAGMHPACGLNVGARAPMPTYRATKTTVCDVVLPGATGLPDAPRNHTSIALSVSAASSPPTM
jgi:hypothetical protein